METEVFVKRILQVVTVLLAAGLVVLLILEFRDRKKSEDYYEDKYIVSAPLRAQKKELERQLAQVKREYQVKINGKGTLTLLCMDLSEDIYTVIYPQMQEYGYIAMLAVSETALPGEEGYMEIEQVEELLDAGWCLCLHWNGEVELEEWLTDMRSMLETQSLEMPKQIYFERETYQTEYDDLLAEHGLEAVVHHQEEGLPALTTQTEEGIWHIGAWGWNQVNARKSMEQALEAGAGLVFTIGGKYYYDEDQFPKMLAVLAEYEAAQSLYVTDVSAAYSYRGETEEARAALQEELEAETAKLETEIAAVNKQILESYGDTVQE